MLNDKIKTMQKDLNEFKQKIESIDPNSLTEKDAEHFIGITNDFFKILGSFEVTEQDLKEIIPPEFSDKNETLDNS